MRRPEGVDWAARKKKSFSEGVGYYNGTMFSPDGSGANLARLCFGHPSAQTVSDGIAELAKILTRHGALGG